jgi:hypothetical protein
MGDCMVACQGKVELYSPGTAETELLNGILNVRDAKSAARFVRNWGLLGFDTSPDELDRERIELYATLETAHALAKLQDPNVHPKVGECLSAGFQPPPETLIHWHDQRNLSDLQMAVRSEPVQWMLYFAERIRTLAEAIRIRRLFAGHDRKRYEEAKKWDDALQASPDVYARLVGSQSLEFWRGQHQEERRDLEFHEYFLDAVIAGARERLSHRSLRGVWVRIDPRDGRPLFEFGSLYQFIEYCLLSKSGGERIPKLCADPECGQPFFPSRRGQEYCPRPPELGKGRSLCEGRHTKKLTRAKKKDTTQP